MLKIRSFEEYSLDFHFNEKKYDFNERNGKLSSLEANAQTINDHQINDEHSYHKHTIRLFSRPIQWAGIGHRLEERTE